MPQMLEDQDSNKKEWTKAKSASKKLLTKLRKTAAQKKNDINEATASVEEKNQLEAAEQAVLEEVDNFEDLSRQVHENKWVKEKLVKEVLVAYEKVKTEIEILFEKASQIEKFGYPCTFLLLPLVSSTARIVLGTPIRHAQRRVVLCL